ncbi:MAG: inositol monophosphatase [Pseudomonadota bacterium]|nr:inositol monophosphatase [Pseudomonadota bacterium]
MTDTIAPRLALAKELAQEAGQLAQRTRAQQDGSFSREKGHQDFVTEADVAVETLIRQRIAATFADDGLLGEEEGHSGSDNALWVVDPIDGTTNYMRGLADWGVSIAFCRDGRVELGVIYAPDLDLLVWARREQGAYIGENPARTAEGTPLDQAVLLLGRSARTSVDDYLSLLKRLIESGLEYRRNGSAAISLAAVALGQVDGFYEAHLNAWDAAAGLLIVEEAGGRSDCGDLDAFLSGGGPVFASAAGLHHEIGALLSVGAEAD